MNEEARHPASKCEGEICTFHNPSEHKMREWPMAFRTSGLVERVCMHGVGHPDPDSWPWVNKVWKQNSYQLHGCDGCCS